MEILLCWLVGLLFTASVYLLLNKNLIRVLFGIILIGSSINLLIFVVGRTTFNSPAFIAKKIHSATIANALPQALILTAIVIGFGVVTYALILITRTWQELGTMDSNNMQLTETKASLNEVES